MNNCKSKYIELLNRMLSFGIDIDVEDLKLIFITDSFSDNKKNTSYHAWFGDKIMDLVFSLREEFKYIDEAKGLHKIKLKYCSDINFVYTMKRLDLSKYIEHIVNLTDKEIATTFEALIYFIYKKDNLIGVSNFLDKIDFFKSYYNENNYNYNPNEDLILKIKSSIKDINEIRDYIDVTNSKKCFELVYKKFKNLIENLYYVDAKEYYEVVSFEDKLNYVASIYNISNNKKNTIINLLEHINDINVIINDKINVNSTKVYFSIDVDLLKKYIDKYILFILNSIISNSY